MTLLEGGHYRYDLVTPGGVVEGCTLGIPGWVNIENAVAAVAALWCASERDGEPLDAERLREALASFEGVKRRFEFYVNTPRQVYMDDYAHHPRELAAAITSVKKMFPGRRLTALFQPHLYTRTRDSTASSPRRSRMPTGWYCCRSIRPARSRFRVWSPR